MAGDGILAQPPGTRLPAPVRRGHVPAKGGPVAKGFQVFFVKIPPPRQEQDRAFGRPGGDWPVDPANGVAIARGPAAFLCGGGNGAPVERVCHVANSSLLGVVTFW